MEDLLLRTLMKENAKRLANLYPDREINTILTWLGESIISVPSYIWKADPSYRISKNKFDRIQEAIERLQKGEPIQYVLGEGYFFGRAFKVRKGVLIPRGETEELVQWVLTDLDQAKGKKEVRILDIGTGSGCIPITLTKEFTARKGRVTAFGLDISQEAIAIAKENANIYETDVEFQQIDLFKAKENTFHSLDIIVSNPPYVPMAEREEIDIHVKHFEPASALFVPDEDPLIFYKQILRWAPYWLTPHGVIYMEIHELMGEKLTNLIGEKIIGKVFLKQDIHGKDRMIKIERLNKPIEEESN